MRKSFGTVPYIIYSRCSLYQLTLFHASVDGVGLVARTTMILIDRVHLISREPQMDADRQMDPSP